MTAPAMVRYLAMNGAWEVLTALLAGERAPRSIADLARRTKLPGANVWRAVRALEALKVVVLEPYGNTRAPRIDLASPLLPSLRSLLALDLTGPHQRAYEFFRARMAQELPAARVRLFGSVARGEERPESDVDITVEFGGTGLRRERVDRLAIRLAEEALDQFAVSVVPLVFAKVPEHLK